MFGIILTGHAGFAEGLASAAKLIMGELEDVQVEEFHEGNSDEALGQRLEMAARHFAYNCVYFTDLAGGSPCRQATLLAAKHGGIVFTGMNLPFLLNAMFDRDGTPEEAAARWLAMHIQVERVSLENKKKHAPSKGGGI